MQTLIQVSNSTLSTDPNKCCEQLCDVLSARPKLSRYVGEFVTEFTDPKNNWADVMHNWFEIVP